MSLTQKRLIQLPLFFLMAFFAILPAEQSILARLPFGLGPVQILPIALTYVALTRSFAKTILWGIILGLVTSLGVPFGFGDMIVAQTWAALVAKLITSTLPVDNKGTFAVVACWQALVARISWRLLTMGAFHGVTWWRFTLDILPSFLTIAAFAYVFFPIFILWDEFFENDSTAVRDLGGHIKRRTL